MSDADRPAARLDPVLLADLRTRLGATPGRVPDAGLVTAVARGHGVWVAPAEATVLAAAARYPDLRELRELLLAHRIERWEPAS